MVSRTEEPCSFPGKVGKCHSRDSNLKQTFTAPQQQLSGACNPGQGQDSQEHFHFKEDEVPEAPHLVTEVSAAPGVSLVGHVFQ